MLYHQGLYMECVGCRLFSHNSYSFWHLLLYTHTSEKLDIYNLWQIETLRQLIWIRSFKVFFSISTWSMSYVLWLLILLSTFFNLIQLRCYWIHRCSIWYKSQDKGENKVLWRLYMIFFQFCLDWLVFRIMVDDWPFGSFMCSFVPFTQVL